MKLKFALMSCFLLCGCISEQEQREAAYRYEQFMQQQCSKTLGFQAGSEGYMNCRMFYDRVFDYNRLDGTKSFYLVERIQNYVTDTTMRCRSYWGSPQAMDKSALWSCITRIEEERIAEIIRQKELDDFKNSLKEADKERRLQERIDAERHRVAREKRKRPSDVDCKVYHKWTGYDQVKCK